jgi:diguanylate cyclase (GGDEF)-like protein/PAS domain S-box-containing protein
VDPTRPELPPRAASETGAVSPAPPGSFAVDVDESFLALMLEHAIDGMCLVRPDGTILATTPAIERMLGLPPRSMVGTFGLERVHDDDQEAALEALAVLASGAEDDGEYQVYRFRHEDGHYVIVELISSQAVDIPGVDEGSFVVSVRDVTEIHEARLALVRSRERRELLAGVAARFVDALDAELDDAVDDALGAVAEHTGADRAYILLLSEDGSSLRRTHGRACEGAGFQLGIGVEMPVGAFAGWRDHVLEQQRLLVDADHPIGPEFAAEAAALGHPGRDDGAILVVPLVREGVVTGFVMLDVIGRAHVWNSDDYEVVRVAADVIGSVLARRDATEESRQTEARFRALVQNSADALIVIDEQAVISHMPIGTRLFGYTAEQLYGMNALELVHPDDLDFAAGEMVRAITEPGYTATNAMRIRHADGHWVPIELMASSHFDDPAINGVVMNVRDHTERDAYASALRNSEERHRTLIANLPGAVYRCHATPPYADEFVSDMIVTLTGYSAAAFIANDVVFDELILAEHRERTDRELEAAIADERPFIIEYPIRHADGSIRWLSEHGQIVYGDDGRPEFLEGFMFDVTSRVEAVLEGRETEQTLETLIDNVPGVVFRCQGTPPYQNLFISDAVEALTGHPSTAFGAGFDFYDLMVEDQHERVEAEYLRQVDHGGSYRVEYQIRHRDGSLRWVEERGKASFAPDGTIQWIDGVIMDLTDRKELEQRLAHDAAHDPLTGLPNRALLLEHLETTLARAERAGTHTAVLFVDLDRFKLVNDAMGHLAGDELLVHFTRRLNSVLREADMAGRTGGDEFVIVCADLDQPEEAEAIAGRVADVLADPFTVQGRTVFVTASIGIALAGGGAVAGDVLRSADAAAYRAKDRGRNRYEVFDDALRAATAAALELETDLHRALERHQLFLRYQPVVDLVSGHLLGAEALARWQHPRRGLLTPDQFLPAAEASGLVVAIGREMLDLAAGALAAVPAESLPMINVNISPRELAQRDLVDRIREVLGDNGVDPRRLCIEITENAVLDELDTAIETLDSIRALGVRLAIDDFGTGYSSLSYLRRLPVDTVKIDRTFTTELNTDHNDVTIVAGIIGLARGLGLEVVAEGVETQRQAEILVELGCTQAQGFLYSPPVALDDLLRIHHPVAEPGDARH